jgi:hypothetical protein
VLVLLPSDCLGDENWQTTEARQKFILRHCHLPRAPRCWNSGEVNLHEIVDEEDTFVHQFSCGDLTSPKVFDSFENQRSLQKRDKTSTQ